MRVWNWMVMSRIIAVTERYAANGASIDYALTGLTGPPLTIAQALRYAMHFHGVRLPEFDVQLLAAAWEYGGELPVADGERLPGALLEKWDGTLALALDRTRAIESAGTYLAVVQEPEPGRYRSSWECPGIYYLGGRI